MARTISAGTVVWVRLGPRGDYKERPAVALSDPDANGDLFIIAGTTQCGFNPPMEIALPWSPRRHPLTRLHKPTVVDLGWVEKIHTSSVREIGGVCPSPVLVEIKQKLRALQQQRETKSA